MNRDHLAIVHAGNPRDKTLASHIEQRGAVLGIHVERFPLLAPPPGVSGSENDKTLYEKVAESGIRTILFLSFGYGPSHLERQAKYLDMFGMLSPEYMIVYYDVVAPPMALPEILRGHVEIGSQVDRLLQGALIVTSLDRPVSIDRETTNKFDLIWQQQPAELVQEVNKAIPTAKTEEGNQAPVIQEDIGYFASTTPVYGAGFVYDSVMAIGLGACRQQLNGSEKSSSKETNVGNKTRRRRRWLQVKGSKDSDNGPDPDEGETKKQPPPNTQKAPTRVAPAIQSIVKTKFTGVSGEVIFEQGRTRDSFDHSIQFGVYNVRAIGEDKSISDESPNTRVFDTVLVARSQLHDDTWVDLVDTVYRDGTSQP